jgi:hypothetical protein
MYAIVPPAAAAQGMGVTVLPILMATDALPVMGAPEVGSKTSASAE